MRDSMTKNECAFCGQEFTAEDKKVMAAFPYTFTMETDKITLVAVEESTCQLSHVDCWEKRNSFAPARRKILKLEPVTQSPTY